MKICLYDWCLHAIGGGQKFNCKIAEHLSKSNDVDILSMFPADKKKLEEMYSVDFSNITFRHLYEKAFLNPALLVLLSSRRVESIAREYDLFFNADAISSVKPAAKFNIMYCHFFGLKWPKQAKSFQEFLKSCAGWILKSLFRNYARSYDAIYCNSNYTKIWLKKKWNADADVIYPPIDIPKKINPAKKNIILSTGRLTPDKNYNFVIECFKAVYDSGIKNYECWILGSEPSAKYLEELRELAQGYPVKIVTNPSNKELSAAYAKSKIFIQAKGLGVNEQKYPALLEHFGMTPVEAMAFGSVPVLLDKGGYKESVENGKSGFLFSTKDEAIQKIKLLIEDEKLRSKMSRNAMQRAKNFSLERMQKEIDKMMKKVRID
ncbi:MAG: glycosyltransferase [archaeon]